MANVTVPAFDEAPDTVVGATPQSVFEFEFPFWESADILVYVDGVELATAAFSVEGFFLQNGVVVEGGYGSGEVTLNTPVSNCTVTIDRMVTAARETQFSRASPLLMLALNADLNKQTARDQDLARRVATVENVQDGFSADVLAAASSASAAASSASAASTSASNAATSASAASTSATAAGTSATNAGTSASAAATSASGAATSATTATTKASEASTSAGAASASATNAANSASGAATSATNAGNSATAAAGSATTAGNAATAAGTSASNAATSASNAATSASDAETARLAAVAATADKADKNGGNLTSLSAWRAALMTGLLLTAEMYGGDATVAANAAYAASLPFLKEVDVDVMIDVTADLAAATTETARHAVLDNAFNWTGHVMGGGYGAVGVKFPQGLIDIGPNNFVRGQEQRRLYLEAAGQPTFVDLTGIASTLIGGTERQVTFSFGTALPAYVVPDYWIGIQNPVGNNDCAAFAGSWRVISIAGDRLSFVARRHFTVTPVDPTSITNGGTSNGISESKVVIPQTCLIGSWSSAAQEGMFTLLDGAVGQSKWMSIASKDTAAEGCIVQISGGAGRWESLDYEVWGTGGDRGIRVALCNGEFYINRGCMGADNRTTTSELIGMQGGGFIGVVRCSMGGGRVNQMSIGQGSGAYITQCVANGGSQAVLFCVGSNTVLAYPNAFGYSARGVYANASKVIANSGGGSLLTTVKNTLGIDQTRGGDIVGPVTSSGDTTASWARADMMRNGGRYITRDVNAIDAGRSVTISNNTGQEATLRGTAGQISITCRENLAHGWIARVSGAAIAGGQFVTINIGTDARDTIAAGATALADGATDLGTLVLPVNAGRVTFNVWKNTTLPYLQILNEDGATRIYDVIVTGDLELGAFTTI